MPVSILAGDITIYLDADNGRKAIKWTGSATGTRTLLELYSETLKAWDDLAQMDDEIPIEAVTPSQFRLINGYFIDDDTAEHLTGGSLFSSGWKSGTTEHILTIGMDNATAALDADVGRTIVGGTTGDTGTLLDFNAGRGLFWIRPDDPAAAGDEFDDPDESYSIQNDPWAQVWQFEDPSTYVDETADANSATNADWQIFPATEGTADIVYLGFAQEFSKAVFDNANGTAGTDGGSLATVWEYWNGSSWASLAGVTDGTASGGLAFTAAVSDGQELTYTVPTDWATTSVNSSPQLYYIRCRITAGTYGANPVYDQGFCGGVAAGAFNRHGRHGEASAAGESAWAGITSIGTLETDTGVYIYREDPDKPAGSFDETRVVATKGSTEWWSLENPGGNVDILVKTKEADSVFGPNPDNAAQAVATFLARQYSKTYSHFIATALGTAGGETVVPFATGDDLNNTTGHRQFTGSSGSGTFVAGEVIGNNAARASATELAILTAVGGTTSDPVLTYYLIGDLDDFEGSESITGYTSGATCTSAAPSDVGPAVLSGSDPVFGATTEDINNGNGAVQYSIRIDPTGSNNRVSDIYERTKYLTRRGSTTALLSQDGQEYVGNELHINYSAQAGGEFTEGSKVYDQTTDAEGILVADHVNGAEGELIIKAVRGTFTAANTVSHSPDPTQTLGQAWTFDSSGSSWVDETADAGSAGGADVAVLGDQNDEFYIGSAKPFEQLNIDIATSGVLGSATAQWQYWNGTTWANLEAETGFTDNTSDLTAAPGFSTVEFPPPISWTARSVNNSAVLYFVRWIVQTANMTTAPVLDEVQTNDDVTATIDTVRTIVPISAAPFGTFAGGKFFGAPGVVFTSANLHGDDVQAYQLVDDLGNTQVPPNTVSVSVGNLISGDSVAVFRRTGTDVNKTQFTLTTGNNLGGTTVVMNASIPADNPTLANSKVRIISGSGEEHRYRYDSYASATFTLSPASTGTDGGTGSLTTIVDGSATFQTDEVEVGDLVRNTTDGVSYSTVVSIDSQTQLTVTDNGQTWASQAYSVNTLVENYGSGDNAYVPIIERIADAATETNQFTFSTNIDVRAVVRRSAATSILPFQQDTTATGALTVTTIRNTDSIIT